MMPSEPEHLISSFIGEGDSFTGEFYLHGSIRIDGHFMGKIDSNNKIIIGEKGLLETTLQAREILVSGKVVGNLIGKSYVHLFKTAEVYGDIFTPSLFVEEGVLLEGRVNITKT